MYMLFPHCLAVAPSRSEVGIKNGGKGLKCLIATLYDDDDDDDDVDACS
jgi:hypothetical protein